MEKTNNKLTLYLSLGTIFIVGLLESISKTAINVAIIPITKTFNLDPTQIGYVLSLFFATYSIMTFFGGVFADKFGSKKVLSISVLFVAIASAFTGVITSFTTLLLARGLLGISQGVYPAVTSVSIAELFPKEKRGTGKAFLTSASPLGSALGSILISALIIKFGWRSAFVIIGALLAVAGTLFFMVYKPIQPKLNKTTNNSTKIPVSTILKIPLVWKLIVCNCGFGIFLWGMIPWLPTYFSKVKHLDMATVGALSSIPPFASFVFMAFSGVAIDKFFANKEKILIAITSAIGAVFVFLIYSASSVPLAFTYFAFANIVLGLPVPIVYIFILKYLKNEIIGKATGVVSFAQQIAGFGAPIIMGKLITYFNGSYFPIFVFVAAGIVIVFVVALTINPDKDVPEVAKAELATKAVPTVVVGTTTK